MNSSLWAVAVIVAIVVLVEIFFSTPAGKKVSRYAPEPFWIYFLSILCGLTGAAPNEAPVYRLISSYVLPAAIFLMLVGSPVTELLRLGRRASIAMVLAAGTMFAAVMLCYAIFFRWLPADSWKAAGALLGTWIGGSANMVAVKEILLMPDADLAPLIIMDTLLSYAWLALLLLGPSFQRRFDRGEPEPLRKDATSAGRSFSFPAWAPVLIAFAVAFACAALGKQIGAKLSAIPASGWALLLATLGAILAALTPLRGMEKAGASERGRIALYVVLAAIGARTQLQAAASAPVFLAFGALVLIVHGALLLAASRALGISLYLAATASQANVGGAVSAPIVAEAYRPGTASVGVLMAVAGAVLGTWAGVAGGWACRWMEQWLR